jgi:hypothetical protein
MWMYHYIFLAASLLMAGCVGLFSKQGLDFDSNRVHLVDEMNWAYFFEAMNP